MFVPKRVEARGSPKLLDPEAIVQIEIFRADRQPDVEPLADERVTVSLVVDVKDPARDPHGIGPAQLRYTQKDHEGSERHKFLHRELLFGTARHRTVVRTVLEAREMPPATHG